MTADPSMASTSRRKTCLNIDPMLYHYRIAFILSNYYILSSHELNDASECHSFHAARQQDHEAYFGVKTMPH